MQDESFSILGTSLASESKYYAKYASWKTQSADDNCKGLSDNSTTWYIYLIMQDESFSILGTSLASESKYYAKYASWKT